MIGSTPGTPMPVVGTFATSTVGTTMLLRVRMMRGLAGNGVCSAGAASALQCERWWWCEGKIKSAHLTPARINGCCESHGNVHTAREVAMKSP
jgi:hypothetical protein